MIWQRLFPVNSYFVFLRKNNNKKLAGKISNLLCCQNLSCKKGFEKRYSFKIVWPFLFLPGFRNYSNVSLGQQNLIKTSFFFHQTCKMESKSAEILASFQKIDCFKIKSQILALFDNSHIWPFNKSNALFLKNTVVTSL